jgi:periplasmic divalent cation tolerance protein
MNDLLVVFVTVGGEEDGKRIARTLIEDGLVACVNILPAIRSIYRWKGSIEDDEETLLIIKTGKEVLEALEDRIREIHPYENPELIAVPVVGGLEAYMDWVREQITIRGPE